MKTIAETPPNLAAHTGIEPVGEFALFEESSQPQELVKSLTTPDSITLALDRQESSEKPTIIPLLDRHGKARAHTLVDRKDAGQSEHRWHLNNGYARRHIREGGKIKARLLLHRVLLNAQEGMDVDHLNGNRLDNRRSNLRAVTTVQNMQNRTKLDSRNKWGFRGVYLSNADGKFWAEAYCNGKKHHAGRHDTPEQAGRAAAELRARLGFHGEGK